MTPDFIGAIICWLLKGCTTNLYRDEWNVKKETRNTIVAWAVALILVLTLLSKV